MMKEYNIISARRIFLLDALGALVTTILLSQVLARFEEIFGMDQTILYLLAALATLFAIYSFSNFLFMQKNWRKFLNMIAWANTGYCLLTLGLVVYHYQVLTWLGIAYFIGEIVVVLVLVRWELQTIRRYG